MQFGMFWSGPATVTPLVSPSQLLNSFQFVGAAGIGRPNCTNTAGNCNQLVVVLDTSAMLYHE
jgi:hypothetical protein